MMSLSLSRTVVRHASLWPRTLHSALSQGRFAHTVAPKPRTTTLYYLAPLDIYKTEKPYHINIPPSALPSHQRQSNEVSKAYEPIAIGDLRGRESDFTLDKSGFQVFKDLDGYTSLKSALRYDEYEDFDTVKRKYRQAVSSFLIERLGAEQVIPFTHEVRRRSHVFPQLPRGTGSSPQPVQGVHVDFTPRWAVERMRMVLDANTVGSILKRRWQVLNVWRPLFGPLQDWPLALCDWQTVDPAKDLVPSDNVYTHVAAETYNVFHNPTHRWYYVSEMQPDETLVFKSFDSNQSGKVARVCPHAAFCNTEAPIDARPRESIECLAVVVYPEGSDARNRPEEEWLP